MASGGGPKSRKPRKVKDPGLRAWKSMPKESRKAIKGGRTFSKEMKSAYGMSLRKQRRERHSNPNTGAPATIGKGKRGSMKRKLWRHGGTQKDLATWRSFSKEARQGMKHIRGKSVLGAMREVQKRRRSR